MYIRMTRSLSEYVDVFSARSKKVNTRNSAVVQSFHKHVDHVCMYACMGAWVKALEGKGGGERCGFVWMDG